jgi:hypothetical protein
MSFVFFHNILHSIMLCVYAGACSDRNVWRFVTNLLGVNRSRALVSGEQVELAHKKKYIINI